MWIWALHNLQALGGVSFRCAAYLCKEPQPSIHRSHQAAQCACETDAYFVTAGMSFRKSHKARLLFPADRWNRKDLTRLTLEVVFSTCFREG
ncbi:hypothetical protein EYF80_058025 [Liparis tanakae]|uniref:Secreted protein n=1 Tax=Liparis tanakae TaxID=230148 RepID=A0A4Z2ESB9_9TELE|nr:hypothetical protein EYF80_058025 [Liparis tanakae]